MLKQYECSDIAASVAPKIIHRGPGRNVDFEKHTYTDGCLAALSLFFFRELHVQPHTSECRQWLEDALALDVKSEESVEQDA